MRKLTYSILSLFLVAKAHAADPSVENVPKSVDALLAILGRIIKYMQFGLFTAAIFLFIIAAYDYLFSKGEPEKVKKAQDAILWGIIALVVGILAPGIPRIIAEILGVKVKGS